MRGLERMRFHLTNAKRFGRVLRTRGSCRPRGAPLARTIAVAREAGGANASVDEVDLHSNRFDDLPRGGNRGAMAGQAGGADRPRGCEVRMVDAENSGALIECQR